MIIIKVMTTSTVGDQFELRKSFDIVPVISSVVLIVISVIFISWTISFFTSTIKADSLRENHFITMEWNLLKELKLQTDKQLEEKDREITEMRQRYRQLALSKVSPENLRELENRIAALQDERAKLIVTIGKTDAESGIEQNVLSNSLKETDSPIAVTELLLIRIANLEAQLGKQKQSYAALEKELSGLDASKSETQAEALSDAGTIGLKDKLAKVRGDAVNMLGALRLKKGEIDKSGRMDIDDLNTWTLLRALASSQAIKAEYPDLLPAVEKYFNAYGRKNFFDGQSDAYDKSIKILQTLIDTLD
jgi:hypothetical protein